MKLSRTILSISFILLLLLNFTSCKKDKTEGASDVVITNDNLLAFNIVLIVDQGQNKNSLRLLTFNKVGNDVTATLDGITSRREQIIKILNNSFAFDTNGDGKIVYTISFKKSSDGQIAVSKAQYVNADNPTYKLADAFENQLAGLSSVKNLAYFNNESSALLRFYTDTWVTTKLPNITGSFYEISTGTWKGKIDNQDYMGISAIKKDLTKYMYVQHGDVLEIYRPN